MQLIPPIENHGQVRPDREEKQNREDRHERPEKQGKKWLTFELDFCDVYMHDHLKKSPDLPHI